MSYQTKTAYGGPQIEHGGGPTIVETAGYRSAESRIRDMISAGERLQQARAEAFDYPDGRIDPDDPGDPTRAPGFDMADAQILSQQAKERIRQRSEERILAAEKAAKEVNENDGKPAESGK